MDTAQRVREGKSIYRPLLDTTLTKEDIRKAKQELNEKPEDLNRHLVRVKELLTKEKELFPNTDDEFLLRFLRARKFNDERAANLIRDHYRKQRSTFDQVSEFDRGRIVAYRDCGLSFREIGSRVGRNQTTVMRTCDRWMQEGTTDQRGRSHPPQWTTSLDDRQIVRMAVTDRSVTSRTVAQHIESVTHHSVSMRTI
ncbi:transposable element Tcb1 transposase [Trichonephila clavipes]|nr:transposable element Tcb1 transposase [Trichonephila clavipes]